MNSFSDKITIISCSSELKSAKNLGCEVIDAEDVYYVEDLNNKIVIRWGAGWPYCNKNGYNSEFKNVVNTYESIRLNVNKPLALKTMRDNGVSTPEIYKNFIPAQQLAVLRPQNHSGGQGFNVVCGRKEISEGYYATQYIQTKTEYRCWFVDKNVISAKRYSIRKSRLAEKYPCRSQWPYDYCGTPNKLKNMVIKASKVIGLEFGAADVLEKDGKYYITELNSAPTLDTNTVINFYKENLTRLLEKKFSSLIKNNC